ncbi:hypothetical protein SAMN04487783_1537 [Agrococcus baldri]|uniref:Transcriptional regulator n=1 Tax=Agrococcus baldri TaxID=153730 RepID=A0AA94KZP2_9MICO|nr:GAF domain-containing protein [Agrococcus baldri]SFS11219.1 hypothetical protein SAMN04487783_1537 [Agrococcus baldri]
MPTWTEPRDGASRLLVERAHDELVAGNPDDPRLAAVRQLVRDSWGRSLTSLAGVEGAPTLELDAEALAAYRSAHPLAGALELIRSLLLPGDALDSGVVVALGDASGRLLWVEGDRRVRALTGDMGFVEGANWSEDVVGTSAPGTALALDRSVQIHGPEHYNRLVQPWSCTAAPVRDPETRRILGVLDVTGGPEAATAQAQLLVDATARAVEGELLVARLRARSEQPRRSTSRPARRATPRVPTSTLRVLGRDLAVLELRGEEGERAVELSERHAELLLMLATHRQGLAGDRLAELVYGDPGSESLRPEMVRLKRVLGEAAPHLVPASRPYRLEAPLETDLQQMLSLLDRGAHRVALAAYPGDALPGSRAPGVEELRETALAALRESLMTEAGVDLLLAFADTAAGADDVELLRQCLRMLPARSPRRAGLVARLQRLE